MKRWLRRVRANLYYLRRPFISFLPLLGLVGFVLVAGGFCFQHLYRHPDVGPLSFIHALYITYCLVFMEHLIPFPDHWLLQAFYFLLPPLGLVVILDGFVRFGYRVLRRDEKELEWIRAMALTYRDHVILCGLGRVGLRVLQQLLRLGEDVVVLEKDAANANILSARKNGVTVMIGSGREDEILSSLNLDQAKSIILATNDDLANLEMALDARKANPQINVVMRMYDQELASKIRDAFNIESAFSTAAQAAPLFATSSSDRSIVNSFYVGDQLLVVANLEVPAGSGLIGRSIGEVTSELPVFILSVFRGEEQTEFPPHDLCFAAGDQLCVQTSPETLKQLHRRNAAQAVAG